MGMFTKQCEPTDKCGDLLHGAKVLPPRVAAPKQVSITVIDRIVAWFKRK